MKLKEIMTPDPEVVRPEANLQEAARLMRDLNVGLIPVCDGDRLQGMLTDRDITTRAVAEGLDPSTVRVMQVMTPEVVSCYEDQDAEEAVSLMEENQIRRIIVLNRDKKMTGIVSLGDVAVRVGRDQLSGETIEQISEPSAPDR